MHRKLISFLGTGDYAPWCYQFNGRSTGKPVEFVQIALAEFFRPSEILIFTTEEAYAKNFAPSGKLRFQLDELVKQGFAQNAKNVIIPSGRSEAEIWEIFNTVLRHVGQDDHLLFDVTHSFRSLPLIALACIQYLRALRNVSLEGIYYGAFEARKDPRDPDQPAPVFDLTPFVELMDWSQAVGEFVKYGECGAMGELLRRKVLPRKKATRGGDQEANLLVGLSQVLEQMNKSLSTCRGKAIYENDYRQRVLDLLAQLKQLPNTLPAFAALADQMIAKVNTLDCSGAGASSEVRRGLGAVQWCLEHNLIQQAYTLLQETIVTHFCQRIGYDHLTLKPREQVSAALAVLARKKELGEPVRDPIVETLRQIEKLAGRELLDCYNRLTQGRNDLDHAGLVDPGSYERRIAAIKEEYPKLIKLLC
jgi:CRISPR-associated DxTHG motif protein